MSEAECDILIVGAGAAGLAAAIAAGGAGRRVLVLERMDNPGLKLRATGGGRCNLTRAVEHDLIMTAFGKNGRFMTPALNAFGPEHIRETFAGWGLQTHAPDGEAVFPKCESAEAVFRMLIEQVEKSGVEMRCNASVEHILTESGRVAGVTVRNERLSARRVILAAGGKSYPALGSDGSGFALAAGVGHTVQTPLPALVPLVTRQIWPEELAGIALPVKLWIDKPKRRKQVRQGDLLFTHRGISGPAVLDVSGEVAALLQDGEVPLRMSFTPETDAPAWEAQIRDWRAAEGKKTIRAMLAGHFPGRVIGMLLSLAGIDPATRMGEFAASKARHLIEQLTACPLTVTDTEGWEKAMVTRGGVRLKEVRPETLESRLLGGLHFAGEVMDLAGPCGGYNLTWAFASGWLAGTSAAALL